MPGPVPVPTAILRTRGSTLVKKRKGEPRPAVKSPAIPKYLDKEAKAYWRRTVKIMLAVSTLSEGDEGILASYCQSLSDRDKFTVQLRREGVTYETDKGYIGKNPKCTLLREAVEIILKCAARLGLSPADRARVHTVPATDKDSPWKKFKRGG